MLTQAKITEIENCIKSDPRFIKLIGETITYKGKEKGHSYASQMETTITSILMDYFGAETSKKDREHGDCYITSNIRNSINIKYGAIKLGQPNMCAMNRIVKHFVMGDLDSYYIVKVKLNKDGYSLKMFDMLDYIDVLSWNSGTGQIMLNEKKFYELEEAPNSSLSIKEKKIRIKDLYEKGVEEHIALRKKQLNENLLEMDKFIQ